MKLPTITSIHNLAALTNKTKIHEISLKLLVDYYSHYILPNNYHYELDDGQSILVKPHKRNFPHLLSMEKIAASRYGFGNNKLYQFKGKDGYKGADKEKIDFIRLKSLGRTKFEENEDKFVFFHFIHKILESPTAVKYIVKKGTVQLDFVFFNEYDKAIVQLGLVKEANEPYYVPTMFVARYMSAPNARNYINDQTAIKVINIQISPQE